MLSAQNIYIKSLDLEEARAVYIGSAHRDFPSDELKPFSMIEKLWNRGCYRGYGFYEKAGDRGDKLRAYAFTMADSDTNMLLLDYFAVCEEARGKGYGSIALSLLKDACMEWDGIMFEVEDTAFAKNEEERLTRSQRIAFYEKNGVVMTDARSHTFGVDYMIMVMPLGNATAGQKIGEKLAAIYKKMLPNEIFMREFALR